MLKKIITLIAILPLAAFAMESTMQQEKQQTNHALLTHLGKNAKSLTDLQGIDINVQSDEDGATLLHKAIDYHNEQLIDILLAKENLKFLENNQREDPITHTLNKLNLHGQYNNIAKKLIIKRLTEMPINNSALYPVLMKIFETALIRINYVILKFIYDSPPFKTIHPEIQMCFLERVLNSANHMTDSSSQAFFQAEYEKFSRQAPQMKSFNFDPYRNSEGWKISKILDGSPIRSAFDIKKVNLLFNSKSFQNYSIGIQYKILRTIYDEHDFRDVELGNHLFQLQVKIIFETKII